MSNAILAIIFMLGSVAADIMIALSARDIRYPVDSTGRTRGFCKLGPDSADAPYFHVFID